MNSSLFKKMQKIWKNLIGRRGVFIASSIVLASFVAAAAYAGNLGDQILPHTRLGVIDVGGLTREEASARIQERLDSIEYSGIAVRAEDKTAIIHPTAIGFDMNIGQAVDLAFAPGHNKGKIGNTFTRIGSLWRRTEIAAPIQYDKEALEKELDDISKSLDTERRDIRLEATGASIALLSDTAPGRVLDRSMAQRSVIAALANLDMTPVELALSNDPPRV